MNWVFIGFAAYGLNIAVGLMAQFGGRGFGRWHHVLYAIVFATAIVAAVLAFHPALVLTLAALGIFPKARPHTRLHPTLALVGLLGYVLTAFTSHP